MTRPPKPFVGYVACSPEGIMSREVADSETFAQSEAAMSFRNHGMCQMPTDWIAAQKAGWRVVRVEVKPINGKAAYNALVMDAFDRLEAADRKTKRAQKAEVEFAGRKRL